MEKLRVGDKLNFKEISERTGKSRYHLNKYSYEEITKLLGVKKVSYCLINKQVIGMVVDEIEE